ncbi:hypothetical protein B0H19DRAFT_1239133 [Mycena capillaripes]|nr:hypothetical protein B0H19DRAFT_1239133 [Mycena capillaripes]
MPHPTETAPLLPSSDPNTEENRSPGLGEAHPVHSKLLKLLFVVAIASICRGVSMFSRDMYHQTVPGSSFRLWVQLPGLTLRMEIWTMFASAVVSFISVGWWSTFGDRRGRKPVLIISLLGTLILDLMYLAFANTFVQEDGISLGLIIEGLLGGFPTFVGVVHAYASDISPNSLSRTAMFGVVQAVSFIFFRVGGYLGLLAHVSMPIYLGYSLSVVLTSAALAYIYRTLPESLTMPIEHLPPQNSAVKYIVLPFSMFLRRGPSRRKVVLLAISIYMYSWTLAFGDKMVVFSTYHRYFPALPRWLLQLIPSVINLSTWLCILPVLASFLNRAYGDSLKSGRLLAKSVAQNSILIATFVGALPALYSLAASYFVALGRGSELGALFGAVSIWVSWGEFISYTSLDDGVYSLSYSLGWVAYPLVISLLFLVPDGPPTQPTEGTVDRSGGAV